VLNLASFLFLKLLDALKILLKIGATPLSQLSPSMTNFSLITAQLRQRLLKPLLHLRHDILEFLPILLYFSVVYYLMVKTVVLLLQLLNSFR